MAINVEIHQIPAGQVAFSGSDLDDGNVRATLWKLATKFIIESKVTVIDVRQEYEPETGTVDVIVMYTGSRLASTNAVIVDSVSNWLNKNIYGWELGG